MKLRGGEFSTGTTGIFQPELTSAPPRDQTARTVIALGHLAQDFLRSRSP